MNVKVVVTSLADVRPAGDANICTATLSFIDQTTDLVLKVEDATIPVTKATNVSNIRAFVADEVDRYAALNGYTIQPADVIWCVL